MLLVERPYARAGDIIVCEKGHEICTFIELVWYGDDQRPASQIGHWRQRKPEIGEFPIPGCAVCGAPFTTGMHYHFKKGWR